MKHRNRRALAIMIVAIVLCLGLSALCWARDVRTVRTEERLIPAHRQGLGQLTADSPAQQTFVAASNGLRTVTVTVSNYNRNGKIKSGELTLWLTDASGAEVGRTAVACAPLRNNTTVALELAEPQSSSAGRSYTLHAQSDVTDADGVTLRIGSVGDDRLAGARLILADGREDPANAMYLTLTYERQTHGWMAALTLLLAAVCFAAGLPLLERRRS